MPRRLGRIAGHIPGRADPVVILPLTVAAGFALAAVAPWLVRVDRRRSIWAIAALPLGLMVVFAALGMDVLDGSVVRFDMAWVPQLGLSLTFALDGLSLLFALLISGIGSLVILYAHRYLGDDSELGRFHALLLAFMASMLGLVLADDLLLLVVFWGLTGVTSFLLIGYEHDLGTSRLSAQQALLVTVAGELAMLGGIVLLGLTAETFLLSELPAVGATVQADGLYGVIVLLVMAGALSKSAQFPFHFWLPKAMAAPSPVSAYLHSATMVTAGVYLLTRLSSTLGGSELWTVVLVASGSITTLIGVGLSLRQHDLKLMLAYSTVAALGMMVLLVGIGTSAALIGAMALLLAHALYKAGLFLVTGIIDHETGTRELDKLGGLRRLMPITAAGALLAGVSMAGIPPLVGFAAKELGLKAALDAPEWSLLLLAVLVVAGAGTVGAAAIAGWAPFSGRRTDAVEGTHDPAWSMWLGPLVLGVIGVVAGLLPWLGSGALVSGAVEAVTGSAPKTTVQPWYDVDIVLVLTASSLALGAAIFVRRLDVRRIIASFDRGHRIGPEKGYVSLERATLSFASRFTAWTQGGKLRLYLLTVIATLVVLVWLTVAWAAAIPPLDITADALVWEVVIAVLIAGGAAVAVTSRSRLGAVTALGIVGYGIALVYVLFSAPDLAIAQIFVETLAVLLFVLVFYHMPAFGVDTARGSRVRDAILATAGGALVTLLVLIASAPSGDAISRFFLEASQPLAKGRNVVNTIIVDFRALDTLGEVAVLAIAGFGVFALLKLRARVEGR